MHRVFQESGKFSKVTTKTITKIINNQLDIQQGQFSLEVFKVVLTKIKKKRKEKLPSLMKYLQKYGRQGNLMTYYSDTATPYITREMDKRLHSLLPQEWWPRNCQELPRHNPYFHKIYNDLLLNCIELEIEKILERIHVFRRKRPKLSDSDNPSNYRRRSRKNPRSNTLIRRFLQGIWLHTLKEDGTNITGVWSPKETFTDIMILDKIMKVKVPSPDRDTDFFDIVAGVLPGDTLTSFLFIICQD